MGVIYIANMVTEECLNRRGNFKYHFPSVIKKVTGIAGLITRKGLTVRLLSPSLVKNNTLKYYKSFDEKYKDNNILHCACFDLIGFHLITSIVSAIVIMTVKRNSFNSVLFYNYKPETAVPALFARIFLSKKIYLDYEDDFLQSDINYLLKIITYCLEVVCRPLLSGAIVVNVNLLQKLRIKNVQIVEGIINHQLMDKFNRTKKPLNKRIIFMYSGSLDKYRGIKQYLDIAIDLNNNSSKKVEFWITGKGPLENYVLEKCKEYQSVLKYYGFVQESGLLELYNQVDCFIVFNDPYLQANKGLFPSKLYEYLSTGRQVLFYGKSSLKVKNLWQFDSINNLEACIESITKGEINIRVYNSEDLIINQEIKIFD